MNIDWSFHAQDQLAEILRTIAYKQSYDNAVRWRLKINGDLEPLADFPESCPNIPPECFYEIPPARQSPSPADHQTLSRRLRTR